MDVNEGDSGQRKQPTLKVMSKHKTNYRTGATLKPVASNESLIQIRIPRKSYSPLHDYYVEIRSKRKNANMNKSKLLSTSQENATCTEVNNISECTDDLISVKLINKNNIVSPETLKGLMLKKQPKKILDTSVKSKKRNCKTLAKEILKVEKNTDIKNQSNCNNKLIMKEETKMMKSPEYGIINKSLKSYKSGSQSTPRKTRNMHTSNTVKHNWGTPATNRITQLENMKSFKVLTNRFNNDLTAEQLFSPANEQNHLEYKITESYKVTPVKTLIKKYEDPINNGEDVDAPTKTTINIHRSIYKRGRVIGNEILNEVTNKRKSICTTKRNEDVHMKETTTNELKYKNYTLQCTNSLPPTSLASTSKKTDGVSNKIVSKDEKCQSISTQKLEGTPQSFRSKNFVNDHLMDHTLLGNVREKQCVETDEETTSSSKGMFNISEISENPGCTLPDNDVLSYFTIPKKSTSTTSIDSTQFSKYSSSFKINQPHHTYNLRSNVNKVTNYFIKCMEDEEVESHSSFDSSDSNIANKENNNENIEFNLKVEDFPPLMSPDKITNYVD